MKKIRFECYTKCLYCDSWFKNLCNINTQKFAKSFCNSSCLCSFRNIKRRKREIRDYFCPDCGKQIDGRGERCRKCSNKIIITERNKSVDYKGSNNPMYGMGHKLLGEKNGMFGRTGSSSPQYGKSPSPKSSFGLRGILIMNGEKIRFKSSLELRIFLYLMINKIQFILSLERIKYIDKFGTHRTYNPDIEFENIVYEIKPSNLVKFNKEKIVNAHKILKQKHKKFKIITEKTFDLSIINDSIINSFIEQNILIFDPDEKNLKKYQNLIRRKTICMST